MIIALAGRRVDPVDAPTVRFPLANRDLVRQRLREAFIGLSARVLVCSAACGADLLALDIAGALGIVRHIILPFPEPRFREMSVTDRPGNWGPLFDQICAEVRAAGRLTTLPSTASEDAAYLDAEVAILDSAVALAAQHEGQLSQATRALAVWDGQSRGPDDLTELFAREATRRGIPVTHISTLAF
jgi:hypothetical protein